MSANKIITINGRPYDALTGLPIDAPEVTKTPTKTAAAAKKTPTTKRPAAKSATDAHAPAQRSQTLYRRATKKPVTQKTVKRPASARHMDIARSSKVTRFAPHPVAKPVETVAEKPDRAPQVHPTAARAIARKEVKNPVAKKPTTAKEVKNAAIEVAMATPKAVAAKKPLKQNKWVRRILIVGSIALLIGLILFAVYRFVPSVSVGIASAQAGVSASYPEYVPDGYGLSHPVTYGDGEVVLEFRSNSSDSSYSISQTRSSWDSSAVLDNVVRPDSGDDYTTTKERGLTVYSYNKNAAWVNGGILYVISSDNAPLSGEQVRRIATSL